MEEVARRNDAPLVPGRGFTISPATDANLRDRIRSLLVSRSRQLPPKTPCSTPDYNYTPLTVDEHRLGYSPIHTESYRFCPAQAIAKLIQLEHGDSDMGANRFDGPAGQIEYDDAYLHPRRTSQPNVQNDRASTSGWTWSRTISGLDQRSQADILGRGASTIDDVDRKKSSASKKSTSSRIPRFHLRTVPPALDVNKVVRPDPLHVPGSYQSEVSAKVAFPAPEATPQVRGHDSIALPIYPRDDHDEDSQKSVDTSTQVTKHDYAVAKKSNPILPRTPSHTTVRSGISVKPSHHLVVKPWTGQTAVGQAAQPILTSSGDHGHSHCEISHEQISTNEDDQFDKGNGIAPTPDEHGAISDSAPQGQANNQLSGQHISDLLAQLPPIRQSTSQDVASPSADPEKPPKDTYAPSLTSIETLPLDADVGDVTPVSPLLPKSQEIHTPINVGRWNQRELPAKDAQDSSQRPNKPSPASRAMSLLSDISAKTGMQTPSLRSITRRKKSDSTTLSSLTTRPYHPFKRAGKDAERLGTSTARARTGYSSLGNGYQPRRLKGTDNTNGTLVVRQQEKNDESFTKVIHDLESLLKEALSIAGHAADDGDTEATHLSPQDHRNGHDYADSSSSSGSSESSRSLSLRSERLDEEHNHTTLPHRLLKSRGEHVTINEPKSNARYKGHFRKARDATPYPAQTRHASTIPQTDNDTLKMERQGTHRELLEVPGLSNEMGGNQIPLLGQSFYATDWAVARTPSQSSRVRLEIKAPLPTPQIPRNTHTPAKEQHAFLQRGYRDSESTVTRKSVRNYLNAQQRPPVQPRSSSMRLKPGRVPETEELNLPEHEYSEEENECAHIPYIADFETAGLYYHPVTQQAMGNRDYPAARTMNHRLPPRQDTAAWRDPDSRSQKPHDQGERSANKDYTLKDRHHFSIREPHEFSLSRSHRRSPIARDWSTFRKRYVATVTCVTTAFMGLIIGIYAGEVPAIQYAIADEHHYTILGNVLFYIGLAVTTGLFYPLPLLHGRKPYTLAALAISIPLQFPQALAINSARPPNVATYRIGLLLPRIFAGIVLGFANINFITTLLDLFGASLQSGNPHQETVNVNDVRRHGGGMGVWLGIWTWCAIGSIGIGFLIGAGIISGLDVSWGFWITIILNAAVLVLNILSPEVRRSAYRRSMAEVRSGGDVSRRVARGEIKMHLESTGPTWWWQEVIAGHVLAIRMLKQPGFAILSIYLGWIYGQVVLVIVVSNRPYDSKLQLTISQLLGALLSKYYRFHPEYVGLAVAIIPLGALFAIPFQKASLFSRSRHHSQRTDSMTFEKRVTWTSHLVRRAIFMISLPFAGLAYTLASNGRPTNYMVPIIFAGLIGFLSNLAIAECHGIMMETFDTSDLQPGMTGRPRRILPEEIRTKRTNFSCFPRVTAGFAITQSFSYVIAAIVTAWGGVAERHLGAQTATAVMAGVLLVLTLLLIGVLTRYKVVQIIPSERFGTDILSGPEDEWKPVIIGNPSGTTRRMSVLELGTLSRWSEIRRRNKLAGPQK